MLLPPQYISVIEDFALTTEPINLWVYQCSEECSFHAPEELSIFDYELNEQERQEYSLVFKKRHRAYGMYSFTNEGPLYIGMGATEEEALAHGVYQIVRKEHWDGGLPFSPSIEYTEAWISYDGKECLPALFAPKVMDDEELGEYKGLDHVWSVEYAPNQFLWASEYVDAVETLLLNLPESYEVH